METQAQLSFEGAEVNDHVRQAVAVHVARLEEKFGRITACTVRVATPGAHHRQGAPYQVHVRLALPDGREVNVNKAPDADERHANLDFAVNDAFRRAGRQLQDHARALQGAIKTNRARTKQPPQAGG